MNSDKLHTFKLYRLVAVAVCIVLVICGCGGGSKGTGGGGFGGTVVTTQSQPLSGVIVTLLETNASDITDVDGRFDLGPVIPTGKASLSVDTGRFQRNVSIADLPSTASMVTVVIQVDEENEDAEAIDVEVTEEHEDSKSPTRSPTRTPIANKPGDENSGTDRPAPTPSPSPVATPESGGTPTPSASPSASPTPFSTPGTQTPSPTQTQTSRDGEDAESEGRIDAISESSIAVRGVSFVVTSSTVVFRGDTQVPFSSLAVGERAHVSGKWQNNQAIARKIEVEG